MTPKQIRGVKLIWAYLAFHARKAPDREQACWAYLLDWAMHGGKTAEVPRSFGGTAP